MLKMNLDYPIFRTICMDKTTFRMDYLVFFDYYNGRLRQLDDHHMYNPVERIQVVFDIIQLLLWGVRKSVILSNRHDQFVLVDPNGIILRQFFGIPGYSDLEDLINTYNNQVLIHKNLS
jgi:hypothetical protein